jgi:hypothetical protein
MEAQGETEFRLVGYNTRKKLAVGYRSAITQSVWNLDQYPRKLGTEAGTVFRLKELSGYDRQHSDVNLDLFKFTDRRLADDADYACRVVDDHYDIIVIDDMGLGFRDAHREKDWKEPLSRLKDGGLVILVVSGLQLPQAGKLPDLWQYLITNMNQQTIAIVSANALRSAGAIIGRRISWENTAEEFLQHVDDVTCMKPFNHLVARFGVTGAIYYNRSLNDRVCTLYYDPISTDGVFRDRHKEGNIIGCNSIFAAWLVRSVANLHPAPIATSIDEIVHYAGFHVLKSCQLFYRHGYGFDEASMNLLDIHGVHKPMADSGCFDTNMVVDAGPSAYSSIVPVNNERLDFLMAAQQTSKATAAKITENIRNLSIDIVVRGVDIALIDAKVDAPIARFGSMLALDRSSIESYRHFESTIRNYLSDDSRHKPLNIAVFGAPGAGKSFAVKQIAASLDDRIRYMSCNLTQIGHDRDALTKEFVRILDTNRSGRIPLMLFDEFDSDGFAYLKLFLAPMEDGTYMFNDESLHLGKCVFVFAGGIYHTYDDFKLATQKHKPMKGPDFDSRLLAHINLLGINRSTTDDGDNGYIVRRAFLLRSFLEDIKTMEADQFHGVNYMHAAVDPLIIRALLEVYQFQHGARSMRAVINLCRKDGNRINRSGIPPKHYIAMHIKDVDNFFAILNGQPPTLPPV